MSNGTIPPQTTVNISLIPQTGMPPIVQSKSRELLYDTLQGNPLFIKNPYGPQKLFISRSNYHW